MTGFAPIFLYGAGGHARAVAQVIARGGEYRVAAVLDDAPDARPPVDAPLRGGSDALASLAAEGLTLGFVAIGDNAVRERLSALAIEAGHELVTLIDPSAVVASDATIGAGTALMAMSFAGAGAAIGAGVIVNTGATVDHDCVVGDYAHVSVGTHTIGGVRIGARSLVCAGAAVVGDVAEGSVVGGVPAKPLSA